MVIVSMFTFGTLGLFINNIAFPSSFIALCRSAIGALMIGLYMLISRHKIDFSSIKQNLKFLLPAGIALGFNWICLFEAYKYTGVAVATLCYYMAPVIIILVSPFLLKEKLTPLKGITSAFAIIGAVLISGIVTGTVKSAKGIFLGLFAAALYAGIVMANKCIKCLSSIDVTFVQLGIAAVVMLVYVLLTEKISEFTFDRTSVIFTIIVSIVHTGIAYLLYFTALQSVPAQTAAITSYIDPVTAIILSAVVLNEKMTIVQIIGTVLILGATLFNELGSVKKQ